MKTLGKSLLVLTLVAVLVAAAVPAFAQDSRTVTITETQINAAYRITNPWRRSVTNVQVDLQPGQAVVSATYTQPRRDPVQVVATFVPTVNNGRVYWSVTEATADGQPASQELINQINAVIASSWRNYIRRQLGTGRISDIEITGSAVIVSLTPR